MTNKETVVIEAILSEVAKSLKLLLGELESNLSSRLEKIEKKVAGVDARIANLEDVFCKVEGQDFGDLHFPGTSRGRVALRANRIDNIERYLENLGAWIEGHPHCVCKDLVVLQFDDRTGMVRNVTGPTSWHCPVHGQVEVK